MKFLHISDLHIGKRLNELSLIEDQKYILDLIISEAGANKVDAVLIAGDVYDKSVPTTEAVTLFDEFLVGLSALKIPVFVISGNHDSPERLAFGSRLIEASGVYISAVYNGVYEPVTLSDEFGECCIYMLPFVKPATVRRVFPEAGIEDYTDAVRVAIENMNIDESKRNLLIAHQFVSGAEKSDTEDISVGGLDNVDASVFSPFDYVSLGHIHRPQSSTERVRYCGAPLKYSFSEAEHKKSLTIVTLKEKGNVQIEEIPLTPLRDMVCIRGSYAEIMSSGRQDASHRESFVRVTLTDEEEIPDAIAGLRTFYPNIMELRYDNTRTRNIGKLEGTVDINNRSPLDLVSEFYSLRNGKDMSEEQTAIVEKLIEEIWGAE